MDFIFEDEVDEVGSDVEAYCPKCKADTTHVVISKYEDEIRRVQCNPCGDVHSFRKPRGESEEDVPEPVSARRRALQKKPNWEEFFAKHKAADAKPYEFRELYKENVMVTHPKFGVGFVSEIVSDSKVEITFKDARRILVHNRRDIPGVPLAAEGDGTPTPPATKPASKASQTAKEAAKESAKPFAKEASPKEAPRDTSGRDVRDAKEGSAKSAKAGPPVNAAPPAPAPSKPAPAPSKPAPAAKVVEAKGGKAASAKPMPKAAKAAAPRGGKSAAKPAAKKPVAKAAKATKAGKKR